jgi:hypothetical protein
MFDRFAAMDPRLPIKVNVELPTWLHPPTAHSNLSY